MNEQEVQHRLDLVIADFMEERGIERPWFNAVTLTERMRQHGFLLSLVPPTPEQAIARNTVITKPMMPGDDSILETHAGAGDMVDDIGAPVVMAKYTPPKDPRVRQLLKDAEAARRAEAEPVVREIFTDPRLDPNYKPLRKK